MGRGRVQQSHEESSSSTFPSIPAFLNPFEIGGLRLGPSAYYFKKWKNEKSLGIGGSDSMSASEIKDVKGSLSVSYRFDPMHLGHGRGLRR